MIDDSRKRYWLLAGAIIVGGAALGYALAYRPPAVERDYADILRLNTLGISEDPDAIIADTNATAIDGIDREMVELEALLAPQ